MKTGEKGFTLIELLIAIPIAALVMLAASGALIQLVQSGNASANMAAIRQAQGAGFWVSRDGLQAKNVIIGPTSDDLCIFEWTDDTAEEAPVRIRYSWVLMSTSSGQLWKLQRQQTVGGVSPTTTTMIVATNLFKDGNASALYWTDNYTKDSFRFQVTSRVSQKTCVRTYEVTPRPEGSISG